MELVKLIGTGKSDLAKGKEGLFHPDAVDAVIKAGFAILPNKEDSKKPKKK